MVREDEITYVTDQDVQNVRICYENYKQDTECGQQFTYDYTERMVDIIEKLIL